MTVVNILQCYELQRRILKPASTEDAFCLTGFKNFKPRCQAASGDASSIRIIIGWPASAESLYDAFSKTAPSHAHTFASLYTHLLHSAHFWHISEAAEEKLFLSLLWGRQ